MVAGGYTVSQIVATYLELTTDDVTAVLKYASQVIDEVKIIPRS